MCSLDERFLVLKNFIDGLDKKEDSLISVLHRAQELFGYLAEDVQIFVARELNIPMSKVYGVITFYSYFTTVPKGKHLINVCTGTACFVKGSGDILEEFKKKLNISIGETTQDGMFTLDTLRCVGACALAPVITIDSNVHGHFRIEDVEQTLKNIMENGD